MFYGSTELPKTPSELMNFMLLIQYLFSARPGSESYMLKEHFIFPAKKKKTGAHDIGIKWLICYYNLLSSSAHISRLMVE
jgi:hypothetical protein